MSVLSEVESQAEGVVSGGIWKVLAIALLIALVASGGSLGFEWWLAARDRDKAETGLRTEQGISAQLRAGIDLQNTRLLQLGQEKLDAEKRGAAAQAVAAASGRRLDSALAKIAATHATTCTEAMPTVNQLLKDIK